MKRKILRDLVDEIRKNLYNVSSRSSILYIVNLEFLHTFSYRENFSFLKRYKNIFKNSILIIL